VRPAIHAIADVVMIPHQGKAAIDFFRRIKLKLFCCFQDELGWSLLCRAARNGAYLGKEFGECLFPYFTMLKQVICLFPFILKLLTQQTTGEHLITDETVTHVQSLVRTHGTDCWWTLPVEKLLHPSYLNNGKYT